MNGHARYVRALAIACCQTATVWLCLAVTAESLDRAEVLAVAIFFPLALGFELARALAERVPPKA